MAKNVYVGNMSYDTSQDRLRELFETYGEVVSVNIITDRDTGRPRGFAFVEMATEEAAKAAIAALDGQNVDGRELRVNEARPRRPRTGGDRTLAQVGNDSGSFGAVGYCRSNGPGAGPLSTGRHPLEAALGAVLRPGRALSLCSHNRWRCAQVSVGGHTHRDSPAI